MKFRWRKMRRNGTAVQAARNELAQSQAALRETQADVIRPLQQLRTENHFAELIRDSIRAGYRPQERPNRT